MRRNFEKAQDYAARHGVPLVFATAQELIDSPEIDAVYIATPPDSHKKYAIAVAAAGKPCCIEKPMAPCHADCLEILSAFEASDTPIFVAYYRRTLPRFLKAKEWIDKGKIGEPRHIHWQLNKPPSERDTTGTYNWRTDAQIAPGGYFDDLASHGLDLFSYLLSKIKSVHGHATNQTGLYSAYDSVTASWIHETGVTGTGFWNFGTQENEESVTILGSKGKIIFSVFSDAPLTLSSGSENECLKIPHPENVQLHHVEAMRDALCGKSQHPSPGSSGAHTSWILDSILGTAR